jgi:hypothetical protein
MDTLVLVERHARPGQEESLLAEMQRLGSGGALRREAGRSVRLFVDTAAPTHIFTVARWTTRAAYEAIVPGDPAVQAFDALCLGPPRRWFFEPLFAGGAGGVPPDEPPDAPEPLARRGRPVDPGVHRLCARRFRARSRGATGGLSRPAAAPALLVSAVRGVAVRIAGGQERIRCTPSCCG